MPRLTVSALLRVMPLCLMTIVFVEPVRAQLGMTNPVNPPDEPCSIQIDPNLPTQLLPRVYRWAPPAFLESDPNFGFTKPDEQNGRLHYFLRDQAGLAGNPATDPTQRVTLIDAVLVYMGLMSPAVGSLAPMNADPRAVGIAVAQLAVTGRRAFDSFSSWHPPKGGPNSGPQDSDLIQLVQSALKKSPAIKYDQASLQNAVSKVLDAAYSALWMIRSNDPVWRAKRAAPQTGWIAVSGEIDTPHRPVNVYTAPYPQYDLPVAVSGPYGTITAATRYMVASINTFIGPDDPPPGFPALPTSSTTSGGIGPMGSSGRIVAGPTVRAVGPQTPFSNTNNIGTLAARQLPVDGQPNITPDQKIIIYIHGGGSRLEEAVPLANNLIFQGLRKGTNYTVISFDMPNSAYGDPFDPAQVYGSTYHPSSFNILKFEEQYVINFIEALDQKLGNIKNRIVAVMGGSLGGNMSLMLARENDLVHPYLKSIVAWSPTSMMPGHGAIDDGLIWNGIVGNASATNWGTEAANTRHDYFHHLYFEVLSKIAGLPSNPVMWYRDGWVGGHGEDCKASYIAQSRFDRYEVYSSALRRWTTAIDTEQAMYSFQDADNGSSSPRYQTIASRLLLAAGEKDCYRNGCTHSSDPRSAVLGDTLDIYGYTHDVANLMGGAPGRTLFIKNTGHSIHDERPQFFAQEIVHFLTEPDTTLKIDLYTGNGGLRWNSVAGVVFMIQSGNQIGSGPGYDLNVLWHPSPGISPNNPCTLEGLSQFPPPGPCYDLNSFEFQANTQQTFTIGLSREFYKVGDIQSFNITFSGHAKAHLFDTGDNWDMDGVDLSALSSPAGTGQMFSARGTPLWRGTSPSSLSATAWSSTQVTQPTLPAPQLSVAIVAQGLSAPGGNSWIVVKATGPNGNSVPATVSINGAKGNTLQQVSFQNTCTYIRGSLKGPLGGVGAHSHTNYEPPVTETSVPARCEGSVSAAGYADGSFRAGWLAGRPTLVSTATKSTGTMLARPLTATAAQLPALSASACATVDGKSCLAAGQSRPRSALETSIVTVTSSGTPVAGASIAVSSQNSQALTNASGVAVVNYNPCASSSYSPQGVPIATPAPCQASASKTGYQPVGISLP
jgi:pimeloyl-ACP methyl ester carboxylesterase